MNATLTSRFLSHPYLIATLGVCLGALACSSNPDTAGTGGSSASSTSGATSGSSASSGSAASSSSGGPGCLGPGYPGTITPLTFMSTDATVLDVNNAPVAGQPVFVCGVDICPFSGMTDATGHAAFNGSKSLDRPAFKFGDALTYARFGVPITTATTMLGMLHTVKLPAAGAAMAAGKSATSGNVTITLAAGTTLDFNIMYQTPAEQELRAAAMPVAMAMPLIDPKLTLAVLYGVAPAETVFCPAAAVTAPNDPQWPAGTDVEFYIHSVEVAQDWAPYARWAKVSDGKVSADGMTISTTPGQGLPVLEVFGIQKKP